MDKDSEISLSDISRFSMIKSSVPQTPDHDRSYNNTDNNTEGNLNDEPMPIIKVEDVSLKKK